MLLLFLFNIRINYRNWILRRCKTRQNPRNFQLCNVITKQNLIKKIFCYFHVFPAFVLEFSSTFRKNYHFLFFLPTNLLSMKWALVYNAEIKLQKLLFLKSKKENCKKNNNINHNWLVQGLKCIITISLYYLYFPVSLWL